MPINYLIFSDKIQSSMHYSTGALTRFVKLNVIFMLLQQCYKKKYCCACRIQVLFGLIGSRPRIILISESIQRCYYYYTISMEIIKYRWRTYTYLFFFTPDRANAIRVPNRAGPRDPAAQCSVKVDIFRDYGFRVFRTTGQPTSIWRRSVLFFRIDRPRGAMSSSTIFVRVSLPTTFDCRGPLIIFARVG